MRSRCLAGRLPSLVSLAVALVGGVAVLVPPAAQAAAPFAETLPPGAVRFDGAVLGGRVYAGGEATTYYVEYGKTVAYGSQVPAAPGDAGSGGATTAALRTHAVSGLEPETTYHYRLVATNASGTSEGADQSFTTPPIPSSGSDRAYEQVSPVQKNGWAPYYGYDGQAVHFPAGLSRDGTRAVFGSWGTFSGAVGGGFTTYRSTRTDSGWATEPLSPPIRDPQGTVLDVDINDLFQSTRDLDADVVYTADPVDPLTDGGGLDIYARGSAQPKWTLMSVGNNGEFTAPNLMSDVRALAVADGGRTVLLQTSDELVPGTAVPGVVQFYLRRRGQTIHIPMPNGEPAPTTPSTGVHDWVNERAMLSDDGSRVTFRVGNQVYQWVEGEGTSWVSEPDTAITPPNVTLVRASRDGKRILMRVNRGAQNQLTADGSVNGGFYEYVDDGAGEGALRYRGGELVHTSAIVFNGMTVASQDLNVVYYQVVFAKDGRQTIELRRLEGNAFEVIARGSSTSIPILQTSSREVIDTNVTPDGSGLLFYSRANITAYDNGDKYMTYLYNEAHGLQCLSCRPDGQAPTQGWPVSQGDPWSDSRTSRISDDGSRAQFMAFDPLLPRDFNNRYDVYEWHDGQTSLLSSGRSPDDSYTVGMSADGQDAVFATSESLLAQDSDGDMDFYDARIGGGFGPEPPRPPAPCEGDLCQGERPADVSADGRPGSETFRGSGNVSQASVRIARVRAVRGSVTRLGLQVSGAGRVSVSGGSVRGSSRAAAKAGRVSLPVALTKSAKRKLRRQGSVVVAVRVAFRASDGEVVTRSLVVTFKRPKNRGR